MKVNIFGMNDMAWNKCFVIKKKKFQLQNFHLSPISEEIAVLQISFFFFNPEFQTYSSALNVLQTLGKPEVCACQQTLHL